MIERVDLLSLHERQDAQEILVSYQPPPFARGAVPAEPALLIDTQGVFLCVDLFLLSSGSVELPAKDYSWTYTRFSSAECVWILLLLNQHHLISILLCHSESIRISSSTLARAYRTTQ